MIPKEQIDYLKQEANIVEVVRSCGVELQRAGSTYRCCCPFHNEKTPSMHVFPRTNTWKCFGCGEGGNAIDFVMKKNGVDFVDALKFVAEVAHYTLTDDHEVTEEEQRVYKRRELQLKINKDAMIWFQMQLQQSDKAKRYIEIRKWSKSTIEEWSLGYAPDDWNSLWQYLKGKGYTYDQLSDSTLFAKNQKGGYYSFFRDRIMFPICNNNHEPVAFSGRVIGNSDSAKYINSKESELYKKGEVFFGMDMARGEIVKQRYAVIVEGNPDTIHMHEIGIRNTVAACGTAFTIAHAKILSKLTHDVVLIYDNDKAGLAATVKTAVILIDAGIKVWVLPLPNDGEKKDPDTFFLSEKHFKEYDENNRMNFFEYVAIMNREDCKNPTIASDFAKDLAKLLIKLDDCSCAAHIESLSKIIPTKRMWNEALKLAKEEYKKDVKHLNENGYTEKQMQMIDVYGFFESEHRYRIQSDPDGAGRYVSNFTLEPIFHVASVINAKRLYRLQNNRGVEKVIELPQKDMVSLNAFKLRVESLGNFLFDGSESDLNKIKAYLYENTKSCTEIEQLGWQREGFWAWSNGIISPALEWTKVDELGTVEFAKRWYYLPALSRFYEEEPQLFQYERKFVHKDSDATLFQLADKMYHVYGDNAIVGLGFYFATLFRDILFKRYNSFPILNIFGQKGTGKTEMALTLLRLFGNHAEGMNMTNSTLPAMADHVSHVCNALVHIDEYKNMVDPEKVEFLKGLYDGTGRSRMNMDKDKKKEMTPVDCGLILTGQEMATKDNALFSRVIFLSVSRTKFSKEQSKAYEDLKRYEKNGLTCITNELLKFRNLFIEHYEEALHDVRIEMEPLVKNNTIETRVLENWTMLIAVYKTLYAHIELPYDFKTVMKVMIAGMENQNTEVKNSNEMASFWDSVNTLLTNGDIEHEYDIKIVRGMDNVKLYKGNGMQKRETTYTQTLDILYINPSRLFSSYAKLMKQTKSGLSTIMDEASLKHYLRHQEEYLGEKMMSFKVPTKNMQMPNENIERTPQGNVLRAPRKSCRAMAFNLRMLEITYGIKYDVEIEMSPEMVEEAKNIINS